MQYRKVGNTNLNVSAICLGTMTFGEQNSQTEAFEQMDYACDKGINFFDTAEIYPIYPNILARSDPNAPLYRRNRVFVRPYPQIEKKKTIIRKQRQ